MHEEDKILFNLPGKEIADTMMRSYPGNDPEFRKHSAAMVRNLFISDKIKFSGWSNNYPESEMLRNFGNDQFKVWDVYPGDIDLEH